MRDLGVQRLLASCLNDACRLTALIDVSSYPGDTEIPSFLRRAKCGKCGGKRVDVRPNWKEQAPSGQARWAKLIQFLVGKGPTIPAAGRPFDRSGKRTSPACVMHVTSLGPV